MPWKGETVSQRKEFVMLMQAGNVPVSRLCRQFGLSRKTAYKWLRRYTADQEAGLQDHSRRPHHSPAETDPATEAEVLKARRQNRVWGGRKLRHWLLARHPESPWPCPSTITAILHRAGLIPPESSAQHRACQRFERPFPNDLWQMDFKGHFPLRQGRCHALTVLDDHSRFNLVLRACPDETARTVQQGLIPVFERYGLPDEILADNGPPWGVPCGRGHTALAIWWMRLGIIVSHGRPRHPQTQGKEERFHRTLKAEVLRDRLFHDLADCQQAFDAWRDRYNLERPHEAVEMRPPVARYQPSQRVYPAQLPPIEYAPGDVIRKVQDQGRLHFQGRVFRLSHSFHGWPVALRPTSVDGVWEVFFCRSRIAVINLHEPPPESGLDAERPHAT